MTPKRDDRRKAAVEKQIDENLRRAFEQDTTEQIPDRFLALLEQLRDQKCLICKSDEARRWTVTE